MGLNKQRGQEIVPSVNIASTEPVTLGSVSDKQSGIDAGIRAMIGKARGAFI